MKYFGWIGLIAVLTLPGISYAEDWTTWLDRQSGNNQSGYTGYTAQQPSYQIYQPRQSIGNRLILQDQNGDRMGTFKQGINKRTWRYEPD